MKRINDGGCRHTYICAAHTYCPQRDAARLLISLGRTSVFHTWDILPCLWAGCRLIGNECAVLALLGWAVRARTYTAYSARGSAVHQHA